MSVDQILSAIVYLVSIFILFLIGKWVYDKINSKFDLRVELVENDNFAVAYAVVGYYLGLVYALGGVLDGPSAGLFEDLLDIFIYGLAAIILMNISIIINDKLLFHKFDNIKELVQDRNAGMGLISGANFIAVGLIIAGAVHGEGGDLITMAVFWALGQAAILIAGFIYNLITPFDVSDEVEKDNVAVGVAFAGMLIAIGNIIRVAIAGDFVSWQENITEFIAFTVFGLILLPILRFFTDKLLLPSVKLTDELVNQKTPNIGAGAIEAFAYIAASLLISWVA